MLRVMQAAGRGRLGRLLLLLLGLGLLGLARASGDEYIFELEDQQSTCFSDIYTKLERVIFEYRVLQGGNKDIDCKILTPNGKVLYKKEKSTGDKLTLDVNNGEFQFCFSNEFSTVTHKKIFFSLRPYSPRRLAQEAGNDQVPTVLTASEVFCEGIHRSMTAIADFQRVYRIREAIGRFVAENLNSRVAWWSAGQAAIVLLAGVGQVLALKFFFTERRASTKPPEDVVPTL